MVGSVVMGETSTMFPMPTTVNPFESMEPSPTKPKAATWEVAVLRRSSLTPSCWQ